MMNSMMNSMTSNSPMKMFAKVKPGLCRMSMSGIAIQTPSGYKTYDVNTGKLVNCADFVFDMLDDIFFVIPTNVINKGDIILLGGKPVCVISTDNNTITALRYEDSSIVTFVPESFIFFGTNYFYSKVVSMFGDVSTLLNGGMEKIMPLLFMSRMMDIGDNNSNGVKMSRLSEMFPMIMMMNSGFNFNSMFGNLFSGMTTPTTSATPVTPVNPNNTVNTTVITNTVDGGNN